MLRGNTCGGLHRIENMIAYVLMKYKKSIAPLLLASTLLASCASPTARMEVAERIAAPAYMIGREIAANPFLLTAFERMETRNMPATVYIEGDGLAYTGRYTPSLDPTPLNPVALSLATGDTGLNVVYLARPCQYNKMVRDDAPCPVAYWTTKRFAPEVIDSMNAALDEIKSRYGVTAFNLVGYSGGGAVAALITAKREDVASLRTVAADLDNTFFTRLHNVDDMPESLNAADVAADIAHVPQRHFTGAKDKIVPASVFESYLARAGNTSCIRHNIVTDASHDKGWAEKWPVLLQAPVGCTTEQ